ncbi:hypothetical protein RHGRI_005370 [Rhododendron griersonianum]|uniref:Uncharacterized protein n=1 Tax=Rhododendron griersonianum TaxID=479676 RepID=A0AAV6LC16_9ERIC|nr:hypothetical protein RHGRI_005370 [Rhododendron griersonianum]
MGRLKDAFQRTTSLVSRSNSEGRQCERLPPPPPHNLQEEQPHRGSVKDRLALPVEDGRAREVYLEHSKGLKSYETTQLQDDGTHGAVEYPEKNTTEYLTERRASWQGPSKKL